MFSTKRSVLQHLNVGGSIRKPTECVRADAALEVTPSGFVLFFFQRCIIHFMIFSYETKTTSILVPNEGGGARFIANTILAATGNNCVLFLTEHGKSRRTDFKARQHPADSRSAGNRAFRRQNCGLMPAQTVWPIRLCLDVIRRVSHFTPEEKEVNKCPQGVCLLPGASRKARQMPSGAARLPSNGGESGECTVTEQSSGAWVAEALMRRHYRSSPPPPFFLKEGGNNRSCSQRSR